MIDLHTHTNMSDGSDAPLELLEKAGAAGCKVFSVTDHDGLEANAIILSALNSEKYAVKFITGCEISSVSNGRNLHLLCYGFNPEASCMKKLAAEGAHLRRQRIAAMFDHLRIKHGIIVPDEDKADILSRAVPGKMHITDAAMKLGVKMGRQEFFDKCLNDMESREFKVEACRVIDAASKAGGIVSFAHPVEVQKEYGIDFSGIAGLVKDLKDKGLAGIEVYHSLHGEREVAGYGKIAEACRLLVSGGSDYHGTYKDVKIGQLTGYGYTPGDGALTILSVV